MMLDDRAASKRLASSAQTSPNLRHFSWTTFEDLIDCLSTIHQRLWVLTNDLGYSRRASDASVLAVCEEALKGHSPSESATEHVLKALCTVQQAQSSAWERRLEEIDVAICAASPIVVELEACARLWSRGALPSCESTNNDSCVALPNHAHPTTGNASPSGPNCTAEESAGFSRSELSTRSTEGHSPPNIFVRRPSSAQLIHPTSFRQAIVGAANGASVRCDSEQRGSHRGECETTDHDNGAHHIGHHRLVDLMDDSLTILAVDSERETPAESSRQDPRDDSLKATQGFNTQASLYLHAPIAAVRREQHGGSRDRVHEVEYSALSQPSSSSIPQQQQVAHLQHSPPAYISQVPSSVQSSSHPHDNGAGRTLNSVNKFVSAHNWFPSQEYHGSPYRPPSSGGSTAGLHSKHSVLFQQPRKALDAIPTAAELLAQRRQSRR